MIVPIVMKSTQRGPYYSPGTGFPDSAALTALHKLGVAVQEVGLTSWDRICVGDMVGARVCKS